MQSMRSTDIIGYSLSKDGSFKSYSSQAASLREMTGDDSIGSDPISDKDQILQLEEELAKLRESTKQALHQVSVVV